LSQRQKILQTVQQLLRRHPRPWLQDDQSSAAFGRESEHLTEIMIQSDENAGLLSADGEQFFVCGAQEILVTDRHHVVTRGFEKICAPATDILVELYFHSRDMTERDRHDPLARHLGTIGDGAENVLMG
jgi:hypothetical protein